MSSNEELERTQESPAVVADERVPDISHAEGDENVNLRKKSLLMEEEITPSSVNKNTDEEVKEEIRDLQDAAEVENNVNSGEISFTVKTPSGKEYSLKQHESATLLEVKESLAKMSDTPMETSEIKLIFKGKPLNLNERTIKEIGVVNGSRLHMIKQLYGATTNSSRKVGANIERSNARERGFIHITIPQGARPGNRLIIHPPGRSRMIVYVPRGHGPGDQLRVQLPDEPAANTPAETVPSDGPTITNSAPFVEPTSENQPPVQQSQPSVSSSNVGTPNPGIILRPSNILKAVCPENIRSGQEILLHVPGNGVMKVCLPPTARPGQVFYFRIAPVELN